MRFPILSNEINQGPSFPWRRACVVKVLNFLIRLFIYYRPGFITIDDGVKSVRHTGKHGVDVWPVFRNVIPREEKPFVAGHELNIEAYLRCVGINIVNIEWIRDRLTSTAVGA